MCVHNLCTPSVHHEGSSRCRFMMLHVLHNDGCGCEHAKRVSDGCVVLPGGEASGSGQAGDAQHSQETDRLPAGSAGD